MADGIEVNIDGLEALTSRLKTLSHDIQFKGGRFALRKAANLIRDAAKSNAMRIDDPETSNSIAENIAVRWAGKQFKRNGDLMFRIGVLGGAKKTDYAAGKYKGGDTFYWRFLEFGTQYAAAQPFMRPAMEENAQKAVDEFIKQYGKALDRAIKRATTQGK